MLRTNLMARKEDVKRMKGKSAEKEDEEELSPQRRNKSTAQCTLGIVTRKLTP